MKTTIFKYLIINLSITILVVTLFAIICLYIYQTYYSFPEISNHEIGVSSYIIYSISALVLYFYIFIATLTTYLNLIPKIRYNKILCFFSFFLIPMFELIFILYINKFNFIVILISIVCTCIYVYFYYKFKKFINVIT